MSPSPSFFPADIFVIGRGRGCDEEEDGDGGGVSHDTSIVDQPDVHRDEFPQDRRPPRRGSSTPSAAQPPIPSSASAVQRRRRQFRQVRSIVLGPSVTRWRRRCMSTLFIPGRDRALAGRAGPFRLNAAATAAVCARHKNVIFGPLVLQRNAAAAMPLARRLARTDGRTVGWPTDIKREQGPFRNPLSGHGEVGRAAEADRARPGKIVHPTAPLKRTG